LVAAVQHTGIAIPEEKVILWRRMRGEMLCIAQKPLDFAAAPYRNPRVVHEGRTMSQQIATEAHRAVVMPCPTCMGRLVYHPVDACAAPSPRIDMTYLCDGCGTELVRGASYDADGGA
jgi:predicted RNA-binding Zn-ribbon protein involved in translation (DUF1610 family)